MFTGLVETLGQVIAAEGDSPKRLTIAAHFEDVQLGESIAIDGCCLTVVQTTPGTVSFEATTETLKRTTLGFLKAGDEVHLERALRLSDRLGGHLVLGHVDAVGTVKDLSQQQSMLYVGIQLPQALLKFCAAQGCITVAGVSLTITQITHDTVFVGLIPHTLHATTFKHLKVGSLCNIEVDMMARYLDRLLNR